MRIKILWIAILLFQFFGAGLANAQVNTPLASLTQFTQDESTSENQALSLKGLHFHGYIQGGSSI